MIPTPTVTAAPAEEQWVATMILVKVVLPILVAFLLGFPILMAFYRQRRKAKTFFNPLYANLVLLALVCICVARPTTVYQTFFGCDLSDLCRGLHVFFLGMERTGLPLAIAMLLIERAWYYRSSSYISLKDSEQVMEWYFQQLTRCNKVLMVLIPWVVSIVGSGVMTYFMQNPPTYLSSQQVNMTSVGKGQIQRQCVLPARQEGAAVYLIIPFWAILLLLCILPGIYFVYALCINYRWERDEKRRGTTSEGQSLCGSSESGASCGSHCTDIEMGDSKEICPLQENTRTSTEHEDCDTSDRTAHGDTDTNDSRVHDDTDNGVHVENQTSVSSGATSSCLSTMCSSQDVEMGNTDTCLSELMAAMTDKSLLVTIVVAVLCLIVTVTSLTLTFSNGWLDVITQWVYFGLETVLVLAAFAFPEIRHTKFCAPCSCWHTTQKSGPSDSFSSCSSEGSFRKKTECAIS